MKNTIIFILCFFIGFFWIKLITEANNEIRETRIQACSQAYNEYKGWIEERFIHTTQDWIVRCATYMTLVYAKESWFWQSRRCIEDNNCFWLKNPTYNNALRWLDYNVVSGRFLKFKNYGDDNIAFARFYARFHMNKHIEWFVRDWSMTDRATYIRFMRDRYWDTYNEIYLLTK